MKKETGVSLRTALIWFCGFLVLMIFQVNALGAFLLGAGK
jgi:hypothetical protein